MFKVAVRVPIADGANIRLIVQEALKVNVGPQVEDDCWKSPALVPVTVIEAMLTSTPVPLLIVTVCAVPVLPNG